MSEPDEPTIETAPHEVRGTYVWTDHGDNPYWATLQLVRAADGGGSFEVDVDGETLTVSLGYKSSGISARPTDSVDQIREYTIFWQTEIGEKFGGFLKPRFNADEFRVDDSDKEFSERKTINVPDDLGEATAFQIVAGTYREPDYYADRLPDVLAALADELDVRWSPHYLAGRPHSYSTITTFERTVRIERSAASKLIKRDGILDRLFNLVSRQRGSFAQYTTDNEEIVGHRYSLDLSSSAMEDLPFVSAPGVGIKVYHPKHPRDDDSDPLYHPRVGVLFKKGKSARINSSGRSFDEWRDLARQLEEILVNLLEWGGVPVEPGPTFVSDPFGTVEASDRSIGFYADPTPEMKRNRDSNFLRVLAEANGSDFERLQHLVADGGEARYDDVADDLDIATSTVYRWLSGMKGLLESDDGVIRFLSERQRQTALDVLDPLADHVDATAAAVADVLDMSQRTFERKGSAFQQWVSKYAVDLVEEGDRVNLKVGAALTRLESIDFPKVEETLLAGMKAWRDAGLDPADFYDAIVEYPDPHGQRHSTLVRSAIR